MLDFSPRLRDALTREFLIIGECESGKVRMWSRGCGPDAGRGADAEREGRLVIGYCELGGA